MMMDRMTMLDVTAAAPSPRPSLAPPTNVGLRRQRGEGALLPTTHDAYAFSSVTPGLDPGVHDKCRALPLPWIAGSSPAMTTVRMWALCQISDGEAIDTQENQT